MDLRPQLSNLQTRINDLSLRERAILFLTITVIIYLMVNSLLLLPLEKEQKQLIERTRALHGEIAMLDQQAVAVVEASRHDPDAEQRQQLTQLEQRSTQLQQQIRDSISGLIEPRQMTQALEQLLTEQKKLHFIRIENLGPQPLLDQFESEEGAVYRHALHMEMEGDFHSALAYLQALETLEWQFRWDEVRLTMLEYPRARISLRVHTLSMQRGWLGV